MASSIQGEYSTSGSSRSLRGVESWLRRSLTASLYISMAENFKMNSLSGCCSTDKGFNQVQRNIRNTTIMVHKRK